MCPVVVRVPELKRYGYGIDGVGFYAFDCQELAPPESVSTAAVIKALVDNVDEDMIDAGLRKLLDANWDYQVRKIKENHFAIVFPTTDSLNICKMQLASLFRAVKFQ